MMYSNPAIDRPRRQDRRRQAVERLIRLEVEDPPDAATLSRELGAAHEPGAVAPLDPAQVGA